MKIGIIGAGNIGSVLARSFSNLQHAVRIANSRGPETLTQLAQEAGATPVKISDIAKDVDLLVVTIPVKNVPLLPKDLLLSLPVESPILDTGNYYPLRDGVIEAIGTGMTESEWTAHMLGRPVIKVFNNIMADSLLRRSLPKGSKSRIALPVSGDDTDAKRSVIALLDDMGFDGLDAGPLSQSWRYEPGTPAYCSDPTLKQLPVLLKKANREKSSGNRDQAAKLMAKLRNDFPPQELVRVARLSAGLDTLDPRSWFSLLRLGLGILRS